MSRQVVLVMGPPGSGKSTLAHSLGLDVYDLDDERWAANEQRFRLAVQREVLRNARAQAAVIRTGSTPLGRSRAVRLCDPTETHIMDTAEAVCIERVMRRGREPLHLQLAGIASWFEQYPTTEPPRSTAELVLPGQRGKLAANDYRRGRTGRPYRRLREMVKRTQPMCWLCHQPIPPRLRFPDPRSFSLDHVVSLKRGGDPLDPKNARASHLLCNQSKGIGLAPSVASRHSENW